MVTGTIHYDTIANTNSHYPKAKLKRRVGGWVGGWMCKAHRAQHSKNILRPGSRCIRLAPLHVLLETNTNQKQHKKGVSRKGLGIVPYVRTAHPSHVPEILFTTEPLRKFFFNNSNSVLTVDAESDTQFVMHNDKHRDCRVAPHKTSKVRQRTPHGRVAEEPTH